LGNQTSRTVAPDKVAIPWPEANPDGDFDDEDMR